MSVIGGDTLFFEESITVTISCACACSCHCCQTGTHNLSDFLFSWVICLPAVQTEKIRKLLNAVGSSSSAVSGKTKGMKYLLAVN